MDSGFAEGVDPLWCVSSVSWWTPWFHGYAKTSSSNGSLKSHFQYILFEPSNPSQPVYGEVSSRRSIPQW